LINLSLLDMICWWNNAITISIFFKFQKMIWLIRPIVICFCV